MHLNPKGTSSGRPRRLLGDQPGKYFLRLVQVEEFYTLAGVGIDEMAVPGGFTGWTTTRERISELVQGQEIFGIPELKILYQ